MRAEADGCRSEFRTEVERIEAGVATLRIDDRLLRCFRLMNQAIGLSAAGKYDVWRPFQIGFLLANLASITDPSADAEIVDIVWFATGGGKTETYLGLLVTAAFYDRLRGKAAGITAWSRFPLRLLSLQQTQRFANALAGAEIVRREEGIGGEPFALGFFVGQSSTPNSIDPDPKKGSQWDASDDAMPVRAQVLEICPFCRQRSIEMAFDRVLWRLEHRCTNDACPWPKRALPFSSWTTRSIVSCQQSWLERSTKPRVSRGKLPCAASSAHRSDAARSLVMDGRMHRVARSRMAVSYPAASTGLKPSAAILPYSVHPIVSRTSYTYCVTAWAQSIHTTKRSTTTYRGNCAEVVPRSSPRPPHSLVTRSKWTCFTGEKLVYSRSPARRRETIFGLCQPIISCVAISRLLHVA